MGLYDHWQLFSGEGTYAYFQDGPYFIKTIFQDIAANYKIEGQTVWQVSEGEYDSNDDDVLDRHRTILTTEGNPLGEQFAMRGSIHLDHTLLGQQLRVFSGIGFSHHTPIAVPVFLSPTYTVTMPTTANPAVNPAGVTFFQAAWIAQVSPYEIFVQAVIGGTKHLWHPNETNTITIWGGIHPRDYIPIERRGAAFATGPIAYDVPLVAGRIPVDRDLTGYLEVGQDIWLFAAGGPDSNPTDLGIAAVTSVSPTEIGISWPGGATIVGLVAGDLVGLDPAPVSIVSNLGSLSNLSIYQPYDSYGAPETVGLQQAGDDGGIDASPLSPNQVRSREEFQTGSLWAPGRGSGGTTVRQRVHRLPMIAVGSHSTVNVERRTWFEGISSFTPSWARDPTRAEARDRGRGDIRFLPLKDIGSNSPILRWLIVPTGEE
jgi:hypothetical protein